ncbi:hypothetical protein TKK_0006498 [Trichogramma kaykai]
MSVKSATAKNPLMAGQQQQQPRLAGGLYSQQPRLSKAKSSPNVSRVVAAPVARCSGGGGNVKFEDKPPTTTTTTNRPLKNVNQSKYSVRSGTPAGAQHTQQQQAKDKGRIVSTALTSASKSKQSHGNARMATSNSNKPDLVGVVKKKSVKDSTSSSSCTILEDRVLLKKGLNSHGPLAAGQTNRLPKKPEELKKKVLGRSTSLWNVHSTPMCGNNNSKTSRYSTGDASCKQLANNKQQQQQYPKQQKQQQRPNSGGLSRATSLWSVPAAAIAQCGLGKMPSRIPLSRQHLANLGQSLVDLSRADRSVERTSSSSSKTVAVVNVVPAEVVAVDEVDRSVDEHIYENCRKKVEEEEDQSPIYENLEEIKKKQRELPELTIFDIERRAEQLMAELEADDDDDIPLQKAPTIQQPTILPKKNTSFAKSQDCLNALRHKPSDCEISIRQIRQNWEKQIKGCTDDGGNNKVVEAPISKKRTLSKSINNVNDAALVESKSNSVINNKCQSKRAKDIEHLVNFFNCKNAESTPNKPTTTTVVATASPVIASSWTKSPVVGVKSRGDKSEKSCGYTSDGNSSEDSGHISNENEPDWKDETLPIEEETIIGSTSSSNGSSNGKIDRDLFLAEIIQDLDVNLVDLDDDDEDDENLDVNDKVKTLVKRESVDSCIESGWDDTIKVQTPARKVPPPPTPTKRHSSTPNKIFFRAGTLERLESQRDEKLTGHIILLQARCRGYLARRKLNTLKLQDLAVRCIQRNVRKLMSVREWSWWRLYVKVAPLLNVHRTEDQLKARTEELEVLRAKVDRLEQERNHLKHDNDRLEAKPVRRRVEKKESCLSVVVITKFPGIGNDRQRYIIMPLSPTTYIEPLGSSSSSSSSSAAAAQHHRNLLHHNQYNHHHHHHNHHHHRDPPNIMINDLPSLSQLASMKAAAARRPPLPPSSSMSSTSTSSSAASMPYHHSRALSKIAVIRPTIPMGSRSPSPRMPSSYHHHQRLRSPSSMSSSSSVHSGSVGRASVSKSPTPRRVFPQEAKEAADLDLEEELEAKEQAPVVFEGSLNFVLGLDKQKVRQNFRPTASHLEPQTASSYLSSKIANFLQRTDHIMDEWKRIGRGGSVNNGTDDDNSNGCSRSMTPSRSATNIMIKAYQLHSRSSSVAKSPSRPVSRLSEEPNDNDEDDDDDKTLSHCDEELSEMTADFAEEHSTSTLAAERIDAEHGERLRLERELQDVNETNKNLQQQAERLEMELLYARAADLNGLTSDAEDGEDGAVYKQRYQHAMRELEFTKRKMAQQHEDDLEQLVGLKKQLEKKLADAYEEVEEQRQVVGQWKRRVQKLNGEMHDLRLLLEEQNARNNLLEKKQRKFDAESANVMDELRQEKAARERMAREKEIAIAEKFTIEQSLSDARLELELKEERLHTLTQELEELTFGGKTEEEVAQLKKAKHELEKKLKDQEEELDDLAGQVQLLEQAKLRLEMSIEQQRKEMRKEMQLRDEELEDVRGNSMKKVKALEQQLENEHEERTLVLREKHELERRLMALEDQDRTDRAAEAENTQRLKRDLKRTRALLRDAQTMLERSKGDSTGKAALRHLKNQLEDAECARAVAVKAKQALEQDLRETQAALEEVSRQRSEAEDRANAANRERAELLSQVEENEEELAEVLKKYRATVQQVADEQAQLSECQVQISALEAEKASLKDQLTELSQRLESVEQLGDPTANSLATRRLEFRTKELESKLELEQTTRARLETQIARLKETVEKLQSETAQLRTKEQSAQDTARRLQRSLREAREEAASASAREQEATRARRDLEKALEASEAETKVVKDDLRLALQRIDDLQSAIQGDLDLDCSEEATSENSDRYGIQF